MNDTILIVDDEKEIADLIELYLINDGYNVKKFYSGIEALTFAEKNPVDLAVLDIMLPDIDGLHICRKIREKYFYPIIMLTAKVEETDKITGLAIGADDYITKPFNPLEVTARVKAQLRRYRKYNTAGAAERAVTEIDINGLTINKENHKCSLYGKEITLTPIEFSPLCYFEERFEKVWGEKYLDSNNTVMAHIARLREKLGEPARNPKFIKTVWGVGYTVEK